MPVQFENVPQEAVGSTPRLEAPLGEPYIIKPEDWIRLQAAGDQQAAFTRAFQGASSLVDSAYNRQIQMKQAQANLDKSVADTKQIGVHTDLLQQEADQNKQLYPLALKAKDLENQKAQIALDNASATQDTNQAAIDQMETAFKNFPDPNDVAGYEAARNKWVTDNPVAMTNPTTAQQMQGQLALRDSIWKSRTSYAQLSDARTELYNLQKAGRIPQNYDIDSGLTDGSYHQQLVQGRLLDKLSQAQKLYNDAPDQATRNALLPIMGDLNYHAKMSPGPDRPASDRGGLGWGAMQVQQGQSNYLDTNGNWNDNTQPIIDAAQNRINLAAQRTQAQLKEKEPMVDIEYQRPQTDANGQQITDPKTRKPLLETTKVTQIPLSQAGPYLQQPGATVTRSAQGPAAAGGAQPGPSPGLPTLSPQIQTRIDDIKRRIDLPENDPQHLSDQQTLDLFRQQFPAPARPGPVPAPTPTQGKTSQAQQPSDTELASYTTIPGGGANTGVETLQPDFSEKYQAWADDMRNSGYNPRIVQAGRNPEYQRQLYEDYRSGRSSNVAAEPHASFHSYGRAFDWVNVGPNGQLEWNNDAAYRAGQQIAARHGLRGLGEKDNDHLEDAGFASSRDLPSWEYGRVKPRGQERLAAAQPAPSPAVPQGAREVATEGNTSLINSTRNDDGSISTFATNFGHDTRGNPDTYDFRTLGASARYGAWGDDLFNPQLAGVAIPAETFRAHFGDPHSEDNRRLIADRRLAVAVRTPEGTQATLPIVDLGPAKGARSRAGLDITGAGMRELGLTDNAHVSYRIVQL